MNPTSKVRIVLESGVAGHVHCKTFEQDGEVFFEALELNILLNLTYLFGKGAEPTMSKLIELLFPFTNIGLYTKGD